MSQIELIPRITTRRIMRYPGAKSIAARYISKLIPGDVNEIVSPFFGGGALELYLTGRHIKIYGADLYEPLVNMWQHVLMDNKKLADRCREILVSSTREELIEYQNGKYFAIVDKFEQAAYFWLLVTLSWNGKVFQSWIMNYVVRDGNAWEAGYPDNKITEFHSLENFYNPYIDVQLSDYRDYLNKYPNTFAYLDPPYPDATPFYAGGDPEFNGNFEHEILRDILRRRETLWVLSYNDKPLIHDLYSGSEFVVKNQWWKQSDSNRNPRNELVIFPSRLAQN